MSTSCICFFRLALILLPFAASAADLPKELLVDGKPLDPLCFENVSADEWLDVHKCQPIDIIKEPALSTDWAKGKIGYNYHSKDDESVSGSYSYYEYLGQWNGAPVIMTYSSGGGSGQFTSLLSFEREGDKIRVLQGFALGDRCNGGVVNAKIEKGRLSYGQWITPYDFLQLADDNPNDMQPYDDLESSAASCYGIARYIDGDAVGITLESQGNEAGTDQKDWTEKFPHQACFNQLYRSYLTKGKKELTLQELKGFTGEFNRLCSKAGE
jgi:hypothetical protein